VGEESCVGERGVRNLTDNSGSTIDELITAIADRYFKIDCAIFTPNADRTNHIIQMAESANANGVIHYGLQFCQPYLMESVQVEKTLEEGSSLMIFPEGTRSETREIKGFKDGAFKIAIKTQTPVIPIVLDGTGEALPKNGIIFRGKELFHVKILDEIPVTGLTEKDAKSLTSKVRHILIDELRKMRIEDGRSA